MRRHRTGCAGGYRSSEGRRSSPGFRPGAELVRHSQLFKLAFVLEVMVVALLTLCTITTCALLPITSVLLLRLSAVPSLGAVLTLALTMLLSTTKLTWRTTVLLLAAIATVLLCGRG